MRTETARRALAFLARRGAALALAGFGAAALFSATARGVAYRYAPHESMDMDTHET